MESTLPRKDLDRLVDRRIRSTVKLAYNNFAFWHSKFRSIGLEPSDIKNKAELLKAFKKGLRITTEEIIQNLENLLPSYSSMVYKKDELWSSGSSGVPKAVRYGQDDWKRIAEQGIFVLESMNLKPNDRFLSLMAPQPFASGLMLREAANQYGLLYLQATPVPTPFLEQTIRRFKPAAIASLGGRMYKLPLEFEDLGVDVKTLGIKSVGIGGEPINAQRRKKISEEWNAPVHDVYATSEAGIMSFSCNQRSGMHVIESRTFATIIDPKSGDETSQGEEGEDLITTLYDIDERPLNLIINYSHGDLSKFLSFDKCACGVTFKRIENPYRVDDIVSLRGVKLNIREIETFLSNHYDYFTGDYIVIEKFDELKRDPFIEVRLEARKQLSEEVLSSLRKDVLMEYIKSNPPALSVMTANDIRALICEKGKLYEGLGVRPSAGKTINLIRRR